MAIPLLAPLLGAAVKGTVVRIIGPRVITAFAAGSLRVGAGLLARRVITALVLQFSFTALWGTIVSTAQFIWNFNWAATDAQLDQQIQGRYNAIGAILGGTLGNAVGWLACGLAPGATIFAFNPAMGAYVLKEVGEEAAEELAANVAALARLTVQSALQTALIGFYKNARRWFFSENNALAQALLGPNYAKARQEYLQGNAKPFTFAQAVEDRIEAIPNLFIRNFIEEFLEEAWEGCVEAGFVLANSVESFLALQKFQQEQALGKERVVEITPDRSVEKEKIVLAGPEKVLMPTIVQTITQHQLLDNRDVGQVFMLPPAEKVSAEPAGITLVVEFCSVPEPPFTKEAGKRFVRAAFQVPYVKRSALDWERIKLACGGVNGYMWGRFLAIAKLSKGREMRVYGATADEAKDRLRALQLLSDTEILSLDCLEEEKEGRRREEEQLYKETTRVYPTFFTVTNREEILERNKGRATLRGNYIEKKARLILWTPKEPPNIQESINDLLRRGQ